MIFILCITQVFAWWEVGHMMTAQIAANHLTNNKRTDVLQWATSLVQDFNSLTDGKSNTFVEAAVWADDIKETGTDFFNNWHFLDRPINEDGLLIDLDYTTINVHSVNGVTRISSILTNTKTAKTRHTVFKAQMIRMLLHLVGDMHQPLHNSNFYNKSYVNGDLGGNRLKIQLVNGSFVNFHSFWDSGAFALQPNDTFLQRPLTIASQQYMEQWAATLIKKYPIGNYKDLDMTNAEVWTYVGFRQAVSFAYPTLNLNNAYNKTYTEQAASFCEENLVIGGYRLAAKLTEIYDIILANEKLLSENQEK